MDMSPIAISVKKTSKSFGKVNAVANLSFEVEAFNRQVRTPADAAQAAIQIASGEVESFGAVFLNAKNGMLSSEVITVGILDASLIHPRELFRRAVQVNAAAIVIVHNHPSGDTSPSAEDISITRKLIEAGRVMCIRIMDHVIVGTGPGGGLVFASMREAGLCDFSFQG